MPYKDKELKRLKDKEYREQNKERLRVYFKDNYQKNKEEILERKRRYYEKTSEHHKVVMKRYNDTHKEERRARDLLNKEEIREYDRKYHKNKMETDTQYRLRRVLRSRLSSALRGKATKTKKTLELLGCPIPELKTHLESQFVEGMTWDNYGEWHIDHIKPCASYDLSDPDQQKECFNFSNLQPLWAYDNMSKGAKL